MTDTDLHKAIGDGEEVVFADRYPFLPTSIIFSEARSYFAFGKRRKLDIVHCNARAAVVAAGIYLAAHVATLLPVSLTLQLSDVTLLPSVTLQLSDVTLLPSVTLQLSDDTARTDGSVSDRNQR